MSYKRLLSYHFSCVTLYYPWAYLYANKLSLERWQISLALMSSVQVECHIYLFNAIKKKTSKCNRRHKKAVNYLQFMNYTYNVVQQNNEQWVGHLWCKSYAGLPRYITQRNKLPMMTNRIVALMSPVQRYSARKW